VRIGDALHTHQEFVIALPADAVRVDEVHTPIIATPLDVLAFLIAIVLAIIAGRLWSCPALSIVGRLRLAARDQHSRRARAHSPRWRERRRP
jgi:hypothetical protein